jgi:LysM repeat protein
MKKWIFLCAPFFWGCTSQLASLRGNQDHVIEEMRTEIADLRHAIHGAEVEIKLLEDRLETQDASKDDKKVAALEKKVESLMAYAAQTTISLTQYRDRIVELDRKLEEIGKLRSQISRPSQEKIYRVKPGDSLEKIARQHSISIENLKRENNLNTDRINIGQELKIPQRLSPD